MADRTIKGIVRRVRRGKATIDLEMGGSIKAFADNLRIGDDVVLGYDFTTMELRNVWTEEEFNNARLAEDVVKYEEEETNIISLIHD